MKLSRKVFWSLPEKEAIVMRSIRLRDEAIYETQLQLFRAAMEALPEHRRRKVREMSEVPWYNPMVNAALAYRCAAGSSSPAEITEAVLRLTCILGSMKQSLVDMEARAIKRAEQIRLTVECNAIDLRGNRVRLGAEPKRDN